MSDRSEYTSQMGLFSRKPEPGRGNSGLANELKIRSNDGYKVLQATELEAYVSRNPSQGGFLLFEKPDGSVGVYAVDSNPFIESGGILDKMKAKWRS